MLTDERLQPIAELVQKFESERNFQQSEADVRAGYIDLLFHALGWNVYNDPGQATNYRREGYVRGAGYVDVGLEIRGRPVLFLEAKRFDRIPASDERTGDRTTEEKQAFRYARAKGIPYAVLTNFERLHVFNADHERLILAFDHPRQYLDRLQDLLRLSPEEVDRGSLPWWEGQLEKRDIDVDFLTALRRWRLQLANAIYESNATHTGLQSNGEFDFEQLMAAVQRILDRLILIRYGDDKEVLLAHDLLENMLAEYRNRGAYARPDHLMGALIDLCHTIDDHHNTALFAAGHICEQVHVPNDTLDQVIGEMNNVSFRKFTSDVLGSTYENYLATKLRLLREGRIEEVVRLELRKRRGIYYTPTWIVQYIVDNTLGRRLRQLEEAHGLHAIERVRGLTILDPACGSGSFLIYAYQVLAEFYRQMNRAIEERRAGLMAELRTPQMDDFLDQLKHLPQPVLDWPHVILNEHLFGVDVDQEAAEIASVNLIMQAFADSRKEKLPLILNESIKVGNSLLSGSETELRSYFGDRWEEKRPFNWALEFPDIMKQGGFDIVIGNPPYVKEYVNRQPFHEVRGSQLARYYQGKADIWYIFACLAIDLLKPSGLHSFIATNNWITAAGASLLRQKVLSETQLHQFLDFGNYKVFEAAGIQTMIYTLEKTGTPHEGPVRYRRVTRPSIGRADLLTLLEGEDGDYAFTLDAVLDVTRAGQVFTFVNAPEAAVLSRIQKVGTYRLKPRDVAQGIVTPQDSVTAQHLPNLRDKTIKPGDGIFILSDGEKRSLSLSHKEQAIVKPYCTTQELGRYFGTPRNCRWVIYTDPSTTARIAEYPRVKAHLDRFAPVMTSDNRPYGLHRARDENFFLGEKLVSLRKTDRPHFTYTDFPCYVSQTYFVIKPTDVDLKYLVAILNSSVCHFWLDKKGKKQGEALQIDKAPLLEIPVRHIDVSVPKEVEMHDRLVALADRMLGLHRRKADRTLPHSEREDIEREIAQTDREIDTLVYDLYGLTADQRALIEAKVRP